MQPTQEPRCSTTSTCAEGPEERAGRRRRRGLPDGVLRVRRTCVVGQFPDSAASRSTSGSPSRTGSSARGVREHRDRRDARRRHARRAQGASGSRSTPASPSSSRRRQRAPMTEPEVFAPRARRDWIRGSPGRPSLEDPRRRLGQHDVGRGRQHGRVLHGRRPAHRPVDRDGPWSEAVVLRRGGVPVGASPDHRQSSGATSSSSGRRGARPCRSRSLIAVLRSLPGPVFFPFRPGRDRLHGPVPRAPRLFLVIYLFGFGMPALGIRRASPNSDVFWAILALVLVYSAYVAEVYRAGIESVHPSQVAAARSLGLTRGAVAPLRRAAAGDPPGHPAAAERLHRPPEGLGARRRSSGYIEAAAAQRRSTQANDFNFTPTSSLAFIYILMTIPQARFVDWLIARDRRKQSGRCGPVTEAVRIEGLHKSFGDLEVLRGIDLRSTTTRSCA